MLLPELLGNYAKVSQIRCLPYIMAANGAMLNFTKKQNVLRLIFKTMAIKRTRLLGSIR